MGTIRSDCPGELVGLRPPDARRSSPSDRGFGGASRWCELPEGGRHLRTRAASIVAPKWSGALPSAHRSSPGRHRLDIPGALCPRTVREAVREAVRRRRLSRPSHRASLRPKKAVAQCLVHLPMTAARLDVQPPTKPSLAYQVRLTPSNSEMFADGLGNVRGREHGCTASLLSSLRSEVGDDGLGGAPAGDHGPLQ